MTDSNVLQELSLHEINARTRQNNVISKNTKITFDFQTIRVSVQNYKYDVYEIQHKIIEQRFCMTCLKYSTLYNFDEVLSQILCDIEKWNPHFKIDIRCKSAIETKLFLNCYISIRKACYSYLNANSQIRVCNNSDAKLDKSVNVTIFYNCTSDAFLNQFINYKLVWIGDIIEDQNQKFFVKIASKICSL